MANESVAIESDPAPVAWGSAHDLWIGEEVLTIRIAKTDTAFPPAAADSIALNEMIEGLARAAKALIYQGDNDARADLPFVAPAISSVIDSIILLSHLSGAVQRELATP